MIAKSTVMGMQHGEFRNSLAEEFRAEPCTVLPTNMVRSLIVIL